MGLFGFNRARRAKQSAKSASAQVEETSEPCAQDPVVPEQPATEAPETSDAVEPAPIATEEASKPQPKSGKKNRG